MAIKITLEIDEEKSKANIDAKNFNPQEIHSVIANMELIKLDLLAKLSKTISRKQ